jgi:hypothetical protein
MFKPTLFTKKVLEHAARYYVCLFLLLYGIGKMIGGQFYRRGELPDEVAAMTLAEAPAFELAWTFMGYSGTYIAFIGISQIVGSLLLLNERTKLLGVTILIPIMVNIVVFDIVFLNAYGALANAFIFLFLLLLILYLNQDKVSAAFRALTQVQGEIKKVRSSRWQFPLTVGTAMAVLFGFNHLLQLWLGYGKG